MHLRAVKIIWWFLKKNHIELPPEPAIPFLGRDPRELRMYVHTVTYKSVFMAARFVIAEK